MAGSAEVTGRIVSLRAAPGGDLGERTLDEMVLGWRNQQLARNLAFSTINGREAQIRRFVADAGEYPWRWSAQLVDEWLGDQRSVHHLRQSTIRGKAISVRLFCEYLTDAAYGWPEECWARFGTHPTQVCHDWNTATHVQDAEGRAGLRAFSVEELQGFFDCADEMVVASRQRGRKGWLSGYRDATLFKVAYAWGLRRREVRMLETTDFGANPHAGVRAPRGRLCAPRQGDEGLGAQTTKRPQRVRLGVSVPRGVAQRVSSPPCQSRQSDTVADRAGWAGRRDADQRALRCGPQRAVPARRGPQLPLPSPVLCHPSHRGRFRSPLRAGTGRPRARLDHLALYLRVVGLPDKVTAPSTGPSHRPPRP